MSTTAVGHPRQAARAASSEPGSSESGRGIGLREFIAGPENALVRVVAEAVLHQLTAEASAPQTAAGADAPETAGTPGGDWYPLVFYGPSGVGKSALVLSLADRWRQTHGPRRLVSLTGADYARDFAAAIQADDLAGLRARHRSALLIALEDLDELAGKEAAQDELTATLDTLLEKTDPQRRIVILATLRCQPAEATFLTPGLASRLSGGLVVPLAAPGREAREVILDRLAVRLGLRFSTVARQWLIDELQGTVPQLQAALHRLAQHAEFSLEPPFGKGPPLGKGSSLGKEEGEPRKELLVKDAAVREFLDHDAAQQRPTLHSIGKQVARRFELRTADLKSASRRQSVVRARSLAMYLARELTGSSLEQVGKHFGGRDHTTVLHACRKTATLLETDLELRQAYCELCTELRRQP